MNILLVGVRVEKQFDVREMKKKRGELGEFQPEIQISQRAKDLYNSGKTNARSLGNILQFFSFVFAFALYCKNA